MIPRAELTLDAIAVEWRWALADYIICCLKG